MRLFTPRPKPGAGTFPVMRKLSLILVATVSTAALCVVVASPAHAKPPKPRAELVTKQPAAAFGSGKVSAGALVKNKGNKKAPASVATFYLSSDAKQSSDDKALGTAQVRKIKPKASKQVSGIFAVPASVTAGTYHVVVCADTGGAVKERKENNNCKGSKGTIQVTSTGPPPGRKVTISWAVAPVAAPLLGSVSGSASNGACTTDPLTGGGSCVVDAGVGRVTLTASPLPLLTTFNGWTGTGCTSASNPVVLANPNTDISCTATFGLLPVRAVG
jgi:hypothetical protein